MQTLRSILNLPSTLLVIATLAALSDVPATAQQAFYAGFLKREVYLDLGGEKIDNLIDAPKFPNAPDLVTFESSFESAPLGFTYGQRFSGFIVPKETARYLFYVAADNAAELFLSTDEASTNKVKIAFEPEWALPREWTGNSDGRRRGCDVNPPACENISNPVLLEVNKKYYVELLHKEGFGGSAGNHVGVTWRKETDPEPVNDSDPIGAEFIGTLADANVTISQQPADVTAAIGERASFSVRVNLVPGGITYQWFMGASAIPGATAAAYTTDPLALSDSGTRYHVMVSTSSGSTVSREAIVTVGAQIFSTGFLKREVYNGIFGSSVDDLRGDPKFPDFPDASEVLPLFEAPSDVGNDYGQKVSGFITPSETANYIFFIASDDNGELWLSTDDTRANLQLIASEPEWNVLRDWVGTARRNPDAPENRSLPMRLEAGRRYYVEALQKEGDSGDNVAVTAIKEGDALPVSGSAPLGGAFIGGFTAPTSATVAFTNAPQNVTTTELATVTFSAGASSTASPISYQWQKNGTNILRANSSSYTTTPLTLADNGAQFLCIAYIPGNVSTTSAIAKVTLDTDVSPPAIKVASALGDPASGEANVVVVVFDEPVEQASAETASNYKLDRSASVLGATLDANLKTVVLTTSTLTGGVDYTLTVNGVKDRSGRMNSTANVTKVFRVTHLVAYYPFDDAANLGADLAGGYDGKAFNGASFTNASLFGPGALNVDGVNDRLVVTKTPTLPFASGQSVSISLWINIPRVRDSWQGVFTSSAGARGIWLSPKNSFTSFRNRYDLHGWVGTDLLGSDATNGWHHLAAVLDGNDLTRNLYVDGTLAITGEGGDTTDDGPWWFGGVEGLSAEFFKGTIDEVRIYNVRLSDDEIRALATPPVQAPPLKIVFSSNGITLSWPAAATGFNLETTVQLSPASWLPVANPPIVSGNDFTLTLPVESGTRFYRLKN